MCISPLTLQRTWATKILNRNTTPTIDATAQSIAIPWDLWTLSYRKTPSIKVPCFSFPISFTHNLCITAKRVNDLFELFHFGLSFSCLCVKNKLTTNGKLGNEAFHRPTGEDHSRPKNDIFSVCGATQAANVPPTATPTKFGEES